MFENIKKKYINKNKKFFKYGLPFLLLVAGGSFGLKEFCSLRYEYTKKTILKPEILQKAGIQMKDPKDITLESEYEKVKKMDIDSWENKRGPRPWEEK